MASNTFPGLICISLLISPLDSLFFGNNQMLCPFVDQQGLKRRNQLSVPAIALKKACSLFSSHHIALNCKFWFLNCLNASSIHSLKMKIVMISHLKGILFLFSSFICRVTDKTDFLSSRLPSSHILQFLLKHVE